MSLRAFSWNINGLRAIIKRGDLQKFIAEHSPDLLALQEIKLHEPQLAELELDQLFPDYQFFWNFAKRKGYAGTAIWVKKHLATSPVNLDIKCITDKYGDACNEGRITTVKINDILVISMYAPNGKEDLSRIPLRLEWDAHINQLLKSHPKALFLGDFNVANEPIDVANPSQKKGKHGFTLEERQDFKNYLAAGFHDIWREENPDQIQYTWWSFRVRERGPNGWRIDYTLTKGIEAKNAQIYEQVRGSDHCPISVEVERAS